MILNTNGFPKPGIYAANITDGVLNAKLKESSEYSAQGIRLEGEGCFFECTQYLPGPPSAFADCDGDKDPRLPCFHCRNKRY